MGARVREAWERVKAAGIDVLTEGIRLAQTAGEQLLQQVAERRINVPPLVQSVLERFVGHEPKAPRDAEEDIEFVCKPAGPDTFACRPAEPPQAPKARPKKAARRASRQPAAKAAAPKRPRKKPTPPAVPPTVPPADGGPTTP